MKLTKQQVKKSLHHQTINGESISYSYVQKYQATLSMLKNQRLLILNSNTGMLYYINEPKQLPFKLEVPKPKNNCANANVLLIKNPVGTNQLNIQFAMNNQKNQPVAVEWNFLLQNKTLIKQWQQVIKDYKDKKMRQIQNAQKKQTETKQPANTAFIHDTLGFGLMQNLKKSQHKQSQNELGTSTYKNTGQINKSNINKPAQQQLRKPNISASKGPQTSNVQQQSSSLGYINNKMAESKFQNSPQIKNVSQSNIRQSNVNIRESNVSDNNNNLRQSTGGVSNIKGSNIGYKQDIKNSPSYNNESPGSQIRRSRNNDQINRSKMTLRDQLNTIIQNSRLRQSKYDNNISIDQSRISDKNYSPENDWNLKFLKQQDQNVIIDFQIFAEKAFFSVLAEDQKANQSIRCYFIKSQAVVLVTDARTPQAKKLKSEFRNYHFIMESCKSQFIVGVPLACLIEFQGLVALVKSTFPEGAPRLQLTQQLLLDLKDLQRYTRIKNNILKKAQLFDLSEIYEIKGKRLIYINQLIQYLPVHIQQIYRGGSLRPQHILDNVNTFMQGGMAHEANRQDMKTLHQALDHIKLSVKQLAKQLSTHDIMFANGIQLKTVMHQKGINLKYLPMLYSQVSNKNIKKYINTFMVAKVAKDNILQNLASLRLDNSNISMTQTVQNSFRLLIQGNTNVSNEFWKQIAINFRKQFGIPMSNHDIIGPFFLNCLMKIIPGNYDVSKLNNKKVFFKDDSIIGKGFVIQLIPKVKSFYRYTSQLTQKIYYTCKQQKLKQNYEAMVQELQLNSKPIPRSLMLSKVDQILKQYLSFYTCPMQFSSQDNKFLSHLKLYDDVCLQPPTTLSLLTTKNFLDWCLDKQKFQEFKKILEITLATIDFWFDNNHPYHCDFYQCLSNYYELTGSIQQSINFMKESLAICIRSGGVTSKRTGYKYYNLGQKQLRAGRKNDSMQNFIKAKNNMQNYNDQTIKYPITLMKLSSLYLNMSEFQNCILYSKQAVQKFQQLQTKAKANQRMIPKGYHDQYCIKAIQIMTRAYEIQNKKNQFYRVAQLASAKYNKTKNPQVYQQLVKICLTAVIFKQNLQKCQVFQSLIEKIKPANNQQEVSPQRCLNQLMILSEQINVMERFMFKFQSLQRIATDINARRALSVDAKEFVNVTRCIIGAIGEDYVYGLIQQKEFQ